MASGKGSVKLPSPSGNLRPPYCSKILTRNNDDSQSGNSVSQKRLTLLDKLENIQKFHSVSFSNT